MARQRDLPASLDLLRGFEAAARHLSFTAAGEELFLTQSAVSRQVQALEHELGVKLFERRTRALVLTPAGEVYFRSVTRALQDLREATTSVRTAGSALVRVTTSVTFASLWLVPRLSAFQSKHQDIPVHVLADNALCDLRRDAIDVAVRYATAELAGENAVMLFGESVTPVCSPALLGRGKRMREPADVLRFPLLHYVDPRVSTPWLAWDVWLEAMRLQAPANARALSFSHYDQLIHAAMAGQGVALGRLPLVRNLIEEGRLVAPLGSSAASGQRRAYWLLVAPAAADRPHVTTFTEWLQAEAARVST